MTQYWYNGDGNIDGNNNWDLLANWWDDAAHTIPSGTLPDNSTDCVILASVADPEANLDQWTPPQSIDCTAASARFFGGSMSCPIVGNPVIANASYNDGELTGDPTFDAATNNNSTINGNPTFSNGGTNSGTINGNPRFLANSSNSYGTINGDPAFFASANSGGTINGNPTFNNGSGNANNATVNGHATFLTISSNGPGSRVNGNAFFSLSSYNYGSVTGAVTYDEVRLAALLTALDGRVPNLDRLDATVSSRSTYAGSDTPGTTTLLGRPAAPGATENATAVWSAGGRTLTSFGSLVADVAAAVWNTATRTLSSFGFGVAANNLPGDYARNNAAPSWYSAPSGGAGLSPAAVAKLEAAGDVLLASPFVPSEEPQEIIPAQPDPALCTGVLRTFNGQGVVQGSIKIAFELLNVPGAGASYAGAFTATSDAQGVLHVPLLRGARYKASRPDSTLPTSGAKAQTFTVPVGVSNFALPVILGAC